MSPSPYQSVVNESIARQGICKIYQLVYFGHRYRQNSIKQAYSSNHEEPIRAEKIYFEKMKWRRIRENNIDKLYIEIPREFIDAVVKSGLEGLTSQDGVHVRWKSGFEIREFRSGISKLAPRGKMYVRVQRWSEHEDVFKSFESPELNDAGEFNGFVTLAILCYGAWEHDPKRCNVINIWCLSRADTLKDNEPVVFYNPAPPDHVIGEFFSIMIECLVPHQTVIYR